VGKWEIVRLGDVCEILDYMRIPVTASERKSGIYPYYGANGIQDYVDDYIFDGELVLLAEDGGNFGSKEKPIAYRVSGKCWVNNHAHVLRPKENLDVDYLCDSIMFYDVMPFISGTTRAKLNQAAVLKMTIPLPPLEVQRKIADVLDRARALIEKRKTQIEKLDLLVKSQFIEMFGDPVTNPKGWEVKKIKDFAAVKIGPFGSLLHAEDYIENGVPLVNPSHIIDGRIVVDSKLTLSHEKYESMSTYALKAGDIVLGRRGEIGRCAVVDNSEYFCGTGSMFIRIERDYLPMVLQRIISSDGMRQVLEEKAVGITMLNLNAGTVANLEAICPPLTLQNEFASFIERVEAKKDLLQRSLAKLELNFKSLMQKCFQGELF